MAMRYQLFSRERLINALSFALQALLLVKLRKSYETGKRICVVLFFAQSVPHPHIALRDDMWDPYAGATTRLCGYVQIVLNVFLYVNL